MTIKVFQAISPTFFPARSPVLKLSDYAHVADVATDSKEAAFTLTNTIDAPWWTNAGVTFLGSPDYGLEGCRSTSVGDLIEAGGQFFEVKFCGFEPVAVS